MVNDPLAGELLGSLTPLGLTGLALLADELRMPAAVAKPLLSPGDFTGLTIGTYSSTIQAEGLAALGAQPKVFTVPRPPATDGLDALETMWWTYQVNSQASFVPFLTGNAVPWRRTVAVFANARRLGELDAAARGWVEQAGRDAVAWSAVHAADRVRQQTAAACAAGARVATATPPQVNALRGAAEPVYARMRADTALAGTLTRIQGLVSSAPRDATVIPASCRYVPGDGSWWLIRWLRGEGELEACQVAGSSSVQWGAGPVGVQA